MTANDKAETLDAAPLSARRSAMMTVAAAAELMGVHVNTVYNDVNRGRLTVVALVPRQGRPALLLDRAEVRRLAKSRHPSARQSAGRAGSTGSSPSRIVGRRPAPPAIAASSSRGRAVS